MAAVPARAGVREEDQGVLLAGGEALAAVLLREGQPVLQGGARVALRHQRVRQAQELRALERQGHLAAHHAHQAVVLPHGQQDVVVPAGAVDPGDARAVRAHQRQAEGAADLAHLVVRLRLGGQPHQRVDVLLGVVGGGAQAHAPQVGDHGQKVVQQELILHVLELVQERDLALGAPEEVGAGAEQQKHTRRSGSVAGKGKTSPHERDKCERGRRKP